MIVRDVLDPTGLTLHSLAYAIGEYPTYLEAVIRGYWHADLNPHLAGYWSQHGHASCRTHIYMLPRIATRLVEISRHLEARGATTHTYDEWMARSEPEYLPPSMKVDVLTREEDVEGGEGSQDPDGWLHARPFLQISAFKRACPEMRVPGFKRNLRSRGYVEGQRRVNGSPMNCWHWNPENYRMPPGQPPDLGLRAPLDVAVPAGIPAGNS